MSMLLLNDRGGRVFWGIANDGVVVGIDVTRAQRDEIRREVSVTLGQIQPSMPIQDINVQFHPVHDEHGVDITDVYILEMDVPRGLPTELYATDGNEVWMKTDGGKQKLNHAQVIAEILRRRGK